jgi:hypothetical protein
MRCKSFVSFWPLTGQSRPSPMRSSVGRRVLCSLCGKTFSPVARRPRIMIYIIYIDKGGDKTVTEMFFDKVNTYSIDNNVIDQSYPPSWWKALRAGHLAITATSRLLFRKPRKGGGGLGMRSGW